MLQTVTSDNTALESCLEGTIGDLCIRPDAVAYMTQALEDLGIRFPAARSQLWRSIAGSLFTRLILQMDPGAPHNIG